MQKIKVVITGDSGVGKTNLLSRYLSNKFSIGSNMTLGLQFSKKELKIGDQTVQLQLWDTAGQQRYRSLNSIFYNKAQGALVVFSLSDRRSFLQLPSWLKEIREHIEPNAVLLLVANKLDLQDRTTTVKEGMTFAQINEMGYIQTSAALDINVREAIQLLASKIVQATRDSIIIQPNKNNILQQQIQEKTQNKKICCK